jgi:hypothetical protein
MSQLLQHPTEWRFQHRRKGEVIWLSGIGEVSVEEFSPEHLQLLRDQPWEQNALADEGEQDLLAVYFRAATAPTTFYVGLLNSTPTDTTTLATMTAEPSGSGYARQQCTRDATGFPTLALDGGDYMLTSAVKTFTAAGGTIGPVTYSFLCTNAASGTSGKFLCYTALSATRTMLDTDSLDVTTRVKLA